MGITVDTLNDLAAHYKLNDNTSSSVVLDASDNENDGVYRVSTTPQNTSVGSSAGKINTSLQVFNANENIKVPHAAELNIGEAEFSIITWVYDSGFSNIGFVSKYNTGTLKGYRLSTDAITPRQVEYYFKDEDGNILTKTSTILLNLDAWNMVAVVVSLIDVKLYVNNVLDRTDTRNFGDVNDGSDLFLGSLPVLGFSGVEYIDDTRIYNRDLTTVDLDSLWNSGDGTERYALVSELDSIGTVVNRMQRGLDHLIDRFKHFNGVTVTYIRGGIQIGNLVGSVGRTMYDVLDGDVMIAHEMRDYIIEKSDLLISSTQIIPQSGDRIVESDGRIYEVSCPKGMNLYESFGPDGTVFKIHTVGKKS